MKFLLRYVLGFIFMFWFIMLFTDKFGIPLKWYLCIGAIYFVFLFFVDRDKSEQQKRKLDSIAYFFFDIIVMHVIFPILLILAMLFTYPEPLLIKLLATAVLALCFTAGDYISEQLGKSS